MKNRLVRYLIKRFFLYLTIFLISLTAFFFFLNLVPGDPVTRYVQELEARYGLTTPVSEEIIKEYKEAFGLDKDLFTRYISYIKRLVLNFDFGPSFIAFPTPAFQLIVEAFPWSIGLLGVTVIISWTLGILLGTLLGWKRESKGASFSLVLGLILSQVPTYLLALILVMVFSFALGTFPMGGAYSPLIEKGFTFRYILDLIYHAFLPAMSLILVYTFGTMISQRALVINILGEDYIKLAEAKGLKSNRLIRRYILRNTLLPQTTGLALSLGFIVNGFFLIEWIFNYPGIGRLFMTAIRQMDYNVLMGITVNTMFWVLTANFIIELLYPLIDPRIRR
jgi:peptide/nickel transport system permease protein